MRYRLLATVAAVSLLTGACAASGDDEGGTDTSGPGTTVTPETGAPDTEVPDTSGVTTAPDDTATDTTEVTDTSAPEAEGPMFGTMESPCGPAGADGAATIAEGQNGGDTLRLGVPTDRGYEARALNFEMYDAAVAFAGWCNDQGGVRGLPIEIVDLDAKLFEVPAAAERACAEAFALVGGGWVFDDQMFPRINECGLINFAGYTVTPAAAMSNAMVQPMPNPLNDKPASHWLWVKENYPDAITRTAIVYTDFLTTQVVLRQIEDQMNAIGGFTVVDRIPTNSAGEANWVPFAQRLKDNNIGLLTMAGSTNTAVSLFKAMREVGFVPEVVMFEASQYSEEMVAEGNGDATEGAMARSAFALFEEADKVPAMASYVEMMDEFNPEGGRALLGLHSISAFLLFVTAANTCLDGNDNVLERDCVLAAGRAIDSWTAGGLHTETNPGANMPPSCGLIVGVQGGEWKRVFPEFGSADDDGNGFHCDGEAGVTHIEGDYGDPAPGFDPNRPE